MDGVELGASVVGESMSNAWWEVQVVVGEAGGAQGIRHQAPLQPHAAPLVFL